MNFNYFLNRIADINLSLDQKKRLYDVIKDIIKDNNDESSINEDTIIQIVKDNIEEIIPNNEFKLSVNLYGYLKNNEPTGELFKPSAYIDRLTDCRITVGNDYYSLNPLNFALKPEDYYNSEYYYIGNIDLFNKEQNRLPILISMFYCLAKTSNFTWSEFNEHYFCGYVNREDTKKTFTIFNEETNNLENKEFNILYNNGFIFIDDGDNSNLYHCGVYILNPKFINNIPTGIK